MASGATETSFCRRWRNPNRGTSGLGTSGLGTSGLGTSGLGTSGLDSSGIHCPLDHRPRRRTGTRAMTFPVSVPGMHLSSKLSFRLVPSIGLNSNRHWTAGIELLVPGVSEGT